MADTNKKASVNPNLKENLCCALFFLLIPLYALVNNNTVYGCIVFGVIAAYTILRYAVFDAPDEQLAIGHFGAYFTTAMIGVILIDLASFLPSRLIFNFDVSPYFEEESFVGLVLGVAMIALKIFVFKSDSYRSFNRLCRIAANHLMIASFAYVLILTFLESGHPAGNVMLPVMAVCAFVYIACDCYEQYRLGFEKHHSRNIGASILLYAVMLFTMLCFPNFNTVTLLYDRFFGLFKVQFVSGILIYAVLMLFSLVCYIICFKGPFASHEIRCFAVYLLFGLTMYRMMLTAHIEFGWLMLFIHTGVLLFALFYKGKAGGKLERTFARHKEYRVAVSGIVLLFAMIMLRDQLYLAMMVLLAFSLVMVFVLTREKDIASKIVWQVVLAGVAVFAASRLISAEADSKYLLAVAMTWFMPAAAMVIFNRGKEEGKDNWAVRTIGILGILLQILMMLRAA